MTNTHYVSVVGFGEATGELYEKAQEIGRLVAERGGTVVCGGLSGVMEAAARGRGKLAARPSESCLMRTEVGRTTT